MYVYSWSGEDIETNLQIAKSVLLHNLYKNGKLSEKDYLDYDKNYAILMRKPSFFSQFWSDLAGKKRGDERPRFVIVKQDTLTEEMMKAEKKEKKNDG